MYVGVASVNEVLTWFNDRRTTERILCFLIADTIRDTKLLETLFAHRGSVNAKLGQEVALFLFSPVATRTMVPKGDDARLLLPHMRSQRSMDDSWRPLPVSEVPAAMRDQVVQLSQGVADEIRARFDLDRDTLPCLVFLLREDETPFVVRTRDAADLKALVKLFEELRTVAEALERSEMAGLPYRAAQTRLRMRERDELGRECVEGREALAMAIPAARRALAERGLDGALDGIDFDTAHAVYARLGLHRDPNLSRRDDALAEVLREGDDEELRALLRTIRNEGRKLRAKSHRYEELRREVDARLARDLNADGVAHLRTTEEELDAICRRFERRFKWRRYVLPLRDFARFFARTAPVAKGIASLADAVEESAQSSSGRP